jgi:hypothetical protein
MRPTLDDEWDPAVVPGIVLTSSAHRQRRALFELLGVDDFATKVDVPVTQPGKSQ